MSVFKKLLGLDTQHHDAVESRSDVQPLGPLLQQKFSRGVNYNMKIVIRGDRTSGKTALFNRIKGGEFTETYVATNEIQVASVNWNYKNSGDIIKVEVWDVVDKGKPRPSSQGLKLSNSPQSQKMEPCLDASFLDVYKGTHGVIIVMDMTKSWTFTYVRRELPRVPPHLPVLVVASHRDMGDKRTVTENQVRAFLEEEAEGRAAPGEFPVSKSPKRAFRVQYCEASMLNGFGLRYVHKFFSLPFLCLQHTVLRQQLARNEMETSHVVAELETDGNAICTNQSAYEAYVQARREKQRVVLTHCSLPESPITASSNTTVPVCTARGVSVQATALLHQATSDVRRGPTSSTDTAVQHTANTPNRCSTKTTSCETASEDIEAFIMVGDTRAVHSNAARQCGPQPNANPVILDFQEEVDPRDVICSPPVASLSCSDSMEFLEEYDDREHREPVTDVEQMRSSQLQCDSSTSKLAASSRLTSQAVQNSLPVSRKPASLMVQSGGDKPEGGQTDERYPGEISGHKRLANPVNGDDTDLVHVSSGEDDKSANDSPVLPSRRVFGLTKPPTNLTDVTISHQIDVFEDKASTAMQAVLQSVVNSTEDADALERFLAES